jgi:phosphoribosylformimino-5-aminoimidazole carboxamide ribotide isomerase
VRGGNAVRLLRGDFAAETVYDADPVAVAQGFAREGARWIHVVDLDAARTGEPVNLPTVAAIAAAVECPVQVGGGVRSEAAAQALIDAGVQRVIIGTAAVLDPNLVERLCAAHPGRVAVGLDAHGNNVKVHGWVDGSGANLLELAEHFAAVGVAALIVTEIGRDGTLDGPDVGQLESVLRRVDVPVIASGGVGSLADLRALDGLSAGERRLVGAIVGRALYEARFTVTEGLAALRA